jgi:hypothetical protein
VRDESHLALSGVILLSSCRLLFLFLLSLFVLFLVRLFLLRCQAQVFELASFVGQGELSCSLGRVHIVQVHALVVLLGALDEQLARLLFTRRILLRAKPNPAHL